MQEVNIGGAFVPAQLLWVTAAFLLSSGIVRILDRTEFYRLVWHRALFDFAVFVIVWGAIVAINSNIAFRNG